MIQKVIFLLVFLSFSPVLFSSPIDDAKLEIEREQKKTAELLQKINDERNRLLIQLENAKQENFEKRELIQKQNMEIAEFKEKIREIERKSGEDEKSRRRLKRVLLESAGELIALVNISFAAQEMSDDIKNLEVLTASHNPVSETFVSSLFRLAIKLSKKAGESVLFEGEYINKLDEKVGGTLLRIGMIHLYALGPDTAMLFLIPGAKHPRVAFELPGSSDLSRSIESGRPVPLDVSGGAAFHTPGDEGFFQTLQKGGPVVWPILLLALLAVLITGERFYVLGRAASNLLEVRNHIEPLIEGSHFGEAEEKLSGMRGVLPRVLLAGLSRRQAGRQAVENALEESALNELPALEKHLNYLGVIAAASPLLGLLGTVTGIISAFDIISVVGAGDPRPLSGGISEALITTQLGLIVAVPVLLTHIHLSGRLDKIVAQLEAGIASFSNRLFAGNDDS